MSPYRERRSKWTTFALSFPFVRTVSIWFLNNVRPPYQLTLARFGRKRTNLFLCFSLTILILLSFKLLHSTASVESWHWKPSFLGSRSTLVYQREDIQKMWQWEIVSGHYPSRKEIPEEIGLTQIVDNPALPPKNDRWKAQPPSSKPIVTITNGVGSKRLYLDMQRQEHNIAYPPRPVPGSVIDLDVVKHHCDYHHKKYVRDCLEVLRVGAGLDYGRLRRVSMDDWKYIYLETDRLQNKHSRFNDGVILGEAITNDSSPYVSRNSDTPLIRLPEPMRYRTSADLESPCDPDHHRIFHMFWTGPFTDKPYLAIISFLYTQNTGLHVDVYPTEKATCRPQLWLWVNPGPADSVHGASTAEAMLELVKSSPWVSPFLHPRFRDVIHFKLWDTTDQLDSLEEIRNEWRSLNSLFESNGVVVKAKHDGDGAQKGESVSKDTYDKLSVVLSDLVRFVLCHRYGGIYLDMDILFLRDWEELWGWKGAFAYAWSGMSRYNTAVLHMSKGSALGTFLLRTAIKHDLDLHPETITQYLRDAYSRDLLYSIPDALFDPAWLNTDHYQRRRPPQPYFTHFREFFDTPESENAGPLALGFDGFFKGAYAYHYHNFWWKPFDPTRNWPDLGPRFEEGERKARSGTSDQENLDLRDLDWSAVLKRTFESYIRGERPNMYGEWLKW
ncbi:hypothetical protein E1B28_001042 [Marasmius oreades]|uniref:Snorna binding protein n=1 Tax=Marasmius oreades TaxID=181124 RepID=A0A9P7V2K4_9AGAR|nr:uncharacterized protein E1B28_001042 [Marasmius oreades]KAG7099171.1 hypothetical protein E1B28_001042 [Marasmius oreades]